MDEQTDERKDLQTAIWTERLNLYIPEMLCVPMYDLNPFKKKNIITGYKHIPRQYNFPVMRMA